MLTPNESAFLTMLAISEGTEDKGDHGYNVIAGGGLFDNYGDHPRKCINMGHGLKTTAAGRYQILSKIFDHYQEQLNLPDFSPASQDAIALQLIKECRALGLIAKGKIIDAICACSSRWASLPGAGYGQHENNRNDLIKAYLKAGGTLA